MKGGTGEKEESEKAKDLGALRAAGLRFSGMQAPRVRLREAVQEAQGEARGRRAGSQEAAAGGG